MKKLVALFFAVLVAAESWATVAITSVKARQRSPFDGNVDIEVQLTGTPEELAEYECVFVATNVATKAKLATTHIQMIDGDVQIGEILTRHFVWNVKTDVGSVKIDEVDFTAGVARKLGGVQLWKDGPYWSEYNVGAGAPEECGYYFWWGDVVGYTPTGGTWDGYYYYGVTWESSTGIRMSSSPFSSSNCQTYDKSIAQLQSEGYIDAKGNLTAAHDAATQHLGSPWRMPTDAEFAALLKNCDTTWTMRSGNYGCLVEGRGTYSSKSIFLPAAGNGDDSYLYGSDSYGNYLSSNPYTDPDWGYCDEARGLYIYSDYINRSTEYRCRGQSVRPVRGFADIRTVGESAVRTKVSLGGEVEGFEVDLTGRIIGLTDDCPESLTIPANITGIAPDVFNGATSLKHLVVEDFDWVKGSIEPKEETLWFADGEFEGKTVYTNNDINEFGSTFLEFTIPDGVDTISFAWKVSSEENYNRLYWYLDGYERGSISGEQDWEIITESLSSGEHTIRFAYTKYVATESYDSDAGWVAVLTEVSALSPKVFADCSINELTIKESAGRVPDSFFAAIPSIEKINVPSKEWWLENAPANNNPIFNGSATLYVDGEEIDLGVMLVAVKAQQQNWGDVDIEVQLLGAEEELANYTLVFGATNVATMDKLAIAHIEQKGDAEHNGKAWTSHYVWDAKADIGEVVIDDVELTASLVRKSNLAECISTCVTHQSVKTCAPDGGPYTGIVDGVEYTFYVENGEAIIENYIDFFGFLLPTVAISTETSGDIVVPSELGGRPVTKIGASAFSGCSLLTSVSIPKSVIEVEGSAFSGCSSLVTISVAKNNEAYCSVEGVLYSKDMKRIVRCPCAKTSVTIPESITTIGDSAFSGCSLLTNVIIPDSVTTIGDSAFSSCGSLTNVTIPDSVVTIGVGAFMYCTSLKSVAIPSGVTVIMPYVFAGCTSLTSVTIPDGVTTIEDWAFAGCASLTSVTIPASVTTIGERAFSGCNSLSEVMISNGVTTIGDYAFYDCSSLTSVTIPASVTTIGERAFSGCNSLKSVTISNGVMTIGASAFSWCSSLTSVTIPASVTTIGESAFYGCSSLISVTISNGTVGVGAFSGCNSLKSVEISNGVTTIGGYAFYDCSSLTSVTISASVTAIGDYAFCYCSSLTSVEISNGVTTIGELAFYDCSSLTSVTIPASVTAMGDYAFGSCTSLKSVTISNGVSMIGGAAFHDCSSLTSVTIPASVTTIESAAFHGCDALSTIYVDKGYVAQVKEMLRRSSSWYWDVDDLTFIERIIGVGPSVDGDDTAGVSGNDESGFVIKPSEGIKDVIVTIPEGVSPEKVTIEVSPEVQSVKPNGATIKVVKGSVDITSFLNIPAAVNGVVNLSVAVVKPEIVKEAMDPAKGAAIELSAENPTLTTAETKPGLTYTLVEGTTLGAMADGDSKIGDGTAWTPSISVKGGASGFYSIKVTK